MGEGTERIQEHCTLALTKQCGLAEPASFWSHEEFLSQKEGLKYRGDGSAVKSACCSFRGPGFDS